MDSKLVTDDLGDLQNELHDISSKWYNLGVQLHIKVGDLENIRREGLVPVDCQREMLMIWLKQVDPHPTRNALIKALKQPVIDEQQLANQLERKYTTDGVIPSAPGSHVSNATTPVPAIPLTSTNQTSGLQLQMQASSRQISQKTGAKQVSVGGAKLSGADRVSKATEIPTVTPTGCKRESSESEVPKAKRPKQAADVERGYTCEFVNPPPDDLLCQKCNYVAKEPQQVKCCGALYCESCLAITTTSHRLHCCVKCKSKTLDHFFDRKSNEQIQKLKVKCTNSDEGCDWTGELKDLDDHRSQCPKEEIPCTLSEVGCQKRLLREDLDNHIAQDQQQHLHCAVTSISRLKQELATTQGELQEVQETLSKCMDEVQTLPKIFEMSNYAQFKTTGDTWYSTPFYSRRSECRLRLCVQPLKNQHWIPSENYSVRQLLCIRPLPTSNHSEKVGIALKLETSPPQGKFISLIVEVLNQAKDAKHYRWNPGESFHSKSCKEKVLQENPGVQYLHNDCLFFRIFENIGDIKAWLVDPIPRAPGLVP